METDQWWIKILLFPSVIAASMSGESHMPNAWKENVKFLLICDDLGLYACHQYQRDHFRFPYSEDKFGNNEFIVQH